MLIFILTDTERFVVVWHSARRTFVAFRLRVPALDGASRAFFARRNAQYWVIAISLGV